MPTANLPMISLKLGILSLLFPDFEVQKTKFAHFSLFLSKIEFVDNFENFNYSENINFLQPSNKIRLTRFKKLKFYQFIWFNFN